MVGEKRKASTESGNVKKRQAISFERNVTILKKLDAGEKMVNVAQTYNMNRSTIGTIYKQKDSIMYRVKSIVGMQFTIISKKRGNLIEEMEKRLSIWPKNQRQRRVPLSLKLIQEKARSIFEDLKDKAGEKLPKKLFLSATAGLPVTRREQILSRGRDRRGSIGRQSSCQKLSSRAQGNHRKGRLFSKADL